MTDYTGQKFGRLTALRFKIWRVFPSGKRHSVWLFKCECGNETSVLIPNVKSGHTKSCGCLGDENRELRVKLNTTHGHTTGKKPHPLYTVWCGMKQRCEETTYHRYSDWGGRGIRVLWKSYDEFYQDMSPTYRSGFKIERNDNNGNYCKSNCRWATEKDQARNRRSNRIIEFKGRNKILIEWSEETGLKAMTLAARLDSGWSIEEALTTPLMQCNR